MNDAGVAGKTQIRIAYRLQFPGLSITQYQNIIILFYNVK